MIHTVTANPALDLTYRVTELKLDDKLRATAVFRAPGGNGVNVSRVAARLKHPTVAMGLVGGRAGDEFKELLKEEHVRTWFTQQSGTTRTNAIIQDDHAQQLRVSGPGPEATPEETAMLRSSIFELRAPDFLVLSGSLQRGMPEDFYLDVIVEAKRQGVKVAADVDKELAQVVGAGVDLIKPNQYELERLTGVPVTDVESALTAARSALERGAGAVLASLGAQGAVLVTPEGAWQGVPPKVRADSAVGAGDSLLSGALVALANGEGWEAALRLGVACGAATAMTPGTDLCHRHTVEELLPRVVVTAL
jgi:6-phosphofructokinase 2